MASVLWMSIHRWLRREHSRSKSLRPFSRVRQRTPRRLIQSFLRHHASRNHQRLAARRLTLYVQPGSGSGPRADPPSQIRFYLLLSSSLCPHLRLFAPPPQQQYDCSNRLLQCGAEFTCALPRLPLTRLAFAASSTPSISTISASIPAQSSPLLASPPLAPQFRFSSKTWASIRKLLVVQSSPSPPPSIPVGPCRPVAAHHPHHLRLHPSSEAAPSHLFTTRPSASLQLQDVGFNTQASDRTVISIPAALYLGWTLRSCRGFPSPPTPPPFSCQASLHLLQPASPSPLASAPTPFPSELDSGPRISSSKPISFPPEFVSSIISQPFPRAPSAHPPSPLLPPSPVWTDDECDLVLDALDALAIGIPFVAEGPAREVALDLFGAGVFELPDGSGCSLLVLDARQAAQLHAALDRLAYEAWPHSSGAELVSSSTPKPLGEAVVMAAKPIGALTTVMPKPIGEAHIRSSSTPKPLGEAVVMAAKPVGALITVMPKPIGEAHIRNHQYQIHNSCMLMHQLSFVPYLDTTQRDALLPTPYAQHARHGMYIRGRRRQCK